MMRNTERKCAVNPMIMISSILFCLVLISTSMMSGLYARYTAMGTGSDSARVIKFGELVVEETGDYIKSENSNDFSIIPGIDLNKDVKVSFGGSEASTIIFVVAETPGWTMSDNGAFFQDSAEFMSWSVNLGNDSWKHLLTSDTQHVYYIELEPNETLIEKQFIKNGVIDVNDVENYIEIFKDYPETSIKITAYAVQSNGFDSVSAAWNSVKTK